MLASPAASRSVKLIDSFDELKRIPQRVSDAIVRVEAMGWFDMCDRETVLVLMASIGCDEEAEWLALRRHLYFVALRQAHDTRVAPARISA